MRTAGGKGVRKNGAGDAHFCIAECQWTAGHKILQEMSELQLQAGTFHS